VLDHAAAGWRRPMPRPLPEAIRTAVTAVGEALADWCLEGRDQPLDAPEAAVLEAGAGAAGGARPAGGGRADGAARMGIEGPRGGQAAALSARRPADATPRTSPTPDAGQPGRDADPAAPLGSLPPSGHGFSVVETVLAVPGHAA
jgi:hypothetical protein